MRLPWQNRHRDIHYIIEHLTETLGADVLQRSHLQVANELFYRNKAARLVGKLITPSGTLPFYCQFTVLTRVNCLSIPA